MQPVRNSLLLLCWLLLAAFRASPQAVPATAAPSIDESRLVTLRGTVHPFAQPSSDRGVVPDSFAANRMLLLLNRPADREAALQKFLREAHIPGSPQYHQWLTPDEFGSRFGPADSDVQTVVNWLKSHGFSVPRVTAGRNFIEFSGTAAQVREALHAEIHQYVVDGRSGYSIAADAAIPEALAPLIRGFAPLNTFEYSKYVETLGPASYSSATKKAKPQFTTTFNNQTVYAVGPEDFATQYDLSPAYSAGIDGTGQTIGIIGDANINLALVDSYRTLFHLPADNTQVVIDGEDPGPALGPNVEGFLDVEVSGSVAPKATINFYIAGGASFQEPLNLAALRAVEDNQASILSVSFGSCEQILGEGGNQFWNALWEQAAAQGQTVFVASGDTGPAACPLGVIIDNVLTYFGPSVNGLSSTPWNVSVGGTDFYYSDYATGAPSAATLWNQTNDSSMGSLKAPLPEQPWDDYFGLNAFANSPFSISEPTPAGGGGSSNCAQSIPPLSLPGIYTCVAGYPKPAWQNAPGVPSDAARDIPDVSLFAANGANMSAYPICANPGDCAPVATGEPQILLVGGTSGSTPAMAGIMALINQKTGTRQGQANFVLYALARQMPGVFHDLTIGSNNGLCALAAPGCANPLPNFPNDGSWGIYNAGPGYDLASGLGSVDASALINNWGEVTFLPTTTSLQLSPLTVVHGSPVSVTVSVQSSSSTPGSMPSGGVDIATTAAVPMASGSVLTLANGSAAASVSSFPGGTYQVTARYDGDGVFASSASPTATLNVTPEPSSVNLTFLYSYLDYTTSPPTVHSGKVSNGGQVPFGSRWAFEAGPIGTNSGSADLATGSVTFTDGQDSLQAPVQANGLAAWFPQLLTVGAHSLTASYSGDASYGASSATPIAFTVEKGNPFFTAVPDALGVITTSNGTPSYVAGSTLVVHVLLGNSGSILPPTGSVTVTLGSQSQTLSLTQDSYISGTLSTAFVTFPNVAAGAYSLSATYTGDSNWNAGTYSYPNSLAFVTMPAVPTSTSVAISPASVTSAESVTFTVTVQGHPGQGTITEAPEGLVSLYANGTIFADAILNTPVSGNPLASTAVAVVPASAIPDGTLQIVANYSGLPPDFAPSTSGPVTLTVTPVDFSLSLGNSRVVVATGQSTSVPILLAGPNGGSVSVSLACAPSSSRIGCSVSASPPILTGSMTSTLSINAFVLNSAARFVPAGKNRPYFPLAGAVSLCILGVLYVGIYNKRKVRVWFAFAVLGIALVAFVAGCGSSGSVTSGPPPPTDLNAPAGTYTVLVTATSNGIAHNAKLTVVVQ